MNSHHKDEIKISLFRFLALAVFVVIAFLLFSVVKNGMGVLSPSFLRSMPSEGMTQGGIWPAIVGTIYVTFISGLFAMPLGVAAAIYLTEYAQESWFTRLLRMAIRNLSGVPSIVYGLFGLALFIRMGGLRPGILTAGMTLGLLILPWTITTAEEAIKSVPQGYRDAARALGASPWFTIRTAVLPSAMPGILTGLVLGLARAAGETAPLLFVGVSFYLPQMPGSIFDQFMALPYHLYVLSTQHQDIATVQPIAYGTALVLVLLIMFLSGGVILWRAKLRKKYRQW